MIIDQIFKIRANRSIKIMNLIKIISNRKKQKTLDITTKRIKVLILNKYKTIISYQYLPRKRIQTKINLKLKIKYHRGLMPQIKFKMLKILQKNKNLILINPK